MHSRSKCYIFRDLLVGIIIGHALVLLTPSSILNAQTEKAQLQQQCDAGNKDSCKLLAAKACDGVTGDSDKLKCSRVAQCYMDLTMLLNQRETLVSGTAQQCEDQNGNAIEHPKQEGIAVTWIPSTSSTVDQLHNGSRYIGIAFPPGKSWAPGVEVYDVPEIPYDYENHAYLYVCAVYAQNNDTHDVGWIPGKLLNNNCNIEFEGGLLIANAFSVASVISDMHGYWAPIPANRDFSKYLQTGPAPGGSRFTVCSAKISTETKFINDPLNAGVHWHGHHLGYLTSNDECLVEWGGNPVQSITDVRVYYVGTYILPALPKVPDLYKDNLKDLGRCTLVLDDGSTRCRMLTQSMCNSQNGRFDAAGSCRP